MHIVYAFTLCAVSPIMNSSSRLELFTSYIKQFTAGPLHSWPATFLQGNAAAAGTALINSMGALGGFIGPSLIGFLADDSDEDDYDAAMMAVGIFMMCAAVLMLGMCVSFSDSFDAPFVCPGTHRLDDELACLNFLMLCT